MEEHSSLVLMWLLLPPCGDLRDQIVKSTDKGKTVAEILGLIGSLTKLKNEAWYTCHSEDKF